MGKSEILSDIEELVSKGKNQEGKILVEEYKKIFGDDSKILSIEAGIHYYEGKLDLAMEAVKAGLKFNLLESDLYSIMGSIYEAKEEFNRAYLCYEQSLYLCVENEKKQYIIEDMNNLLNKYNVSINKISFVILTYNNLEYTQKCIESIRNNVNPSIYEIVVVDNNSTDATKKWLKEQKDIKCVINERNEGFPKGCNQGIEVASKDNDIFLLNNDTIVMPNSIFNLRMGLYSNDNVGAVGSVSNSVVYYQKVDLSGNDEDEYYKNILKNNVTDEASYEERTKLIGFAMLIKRNVLDSVGNLDERFTPGNYEDDDISVRIIKRGYKLLLCKDSFIHHFGSVSFKKKPQQFSELLKLNNRKFIDKWGFESARSMVLYRVDSCFINKNDKNVLEINCGMGSNLVYLRNALKEANFYGIENNKNLRPFLRDLGINCINTYKNKKYENLFDCIIINNCTVSEYDNYIRDISKYIVKGSGRIIVNLDSYFTDLESFDKTYIQNIENKMLMNGFDITNIYNYQDGDKIYSSHMCYEYIDEEKAKLKVNELLNKGKLTDAKLYISRLENYEICENIDLVKQKYSSLIEILEAIKFSFRRLEYKDADIEEKIYGIIEENNISDSAIVQIIEENIIDKIKVLNAIAIGFFTREKYDRVLEYLKAAYNIDKENVDTLYNMGYVLNAYGEKKLALKYLNECKVEDEGIKELISEIREG